MGLIRVFVCFVTVSVCFGAEDGERGAATEHDARKGHGSRHHSAKEAYRTKRYCAKPKLEKAKKPQGKKDRHIFEIINQDASMDLTDF